MKAATQFSSVRENEADLRFHALFDAAGVGLAICRLDGRILEANPALAAMLGHSREELAGAEAHALFPELEHGPRDGRDLGRRWLEPLLDGRRAASEIERNYRRSRGPDLACHLTLSLARDERQQPAFLIATVSDSSARKQIEERLRAAEKMEVIGRLAGGIAHDFNNLLTGILLYCDLLAAGLREIESASVELPGLGKGRNADDAPPDPGQLRQHVEELRLAGEQGAAITQQLLALARKQAAEPRPVRLNEVVASSQNLLRRLIGEPIELVTALDPAAGLVLADPAQLQQVLMNLVLNARDALPQGGKIRLITRAGEFPRAASADGPRAAVSLAVQDNGCGMTAETRARLFEPFFTTKKEGEGTGLGLATVQRMVEEAGGVIEVASEPGRGTCIEVFWPALASAGGALSGDLSEECLAGWLSGCAMPAATAGSPPETIRDFAADAAMAPRRTTILLVDDHTATRHSMQRVLLDAGYAIMPAANGQQALKVFADHASDVDLLITDCMMPGMTGPELAGMLRLREPQLKVLLVSGYRQAVPLAGAVDLIQKPFSGQALLARVEQVMHNQ